MNRRKSSPSCLVASRYPPDHATGRHACVGYLPQAGTHPDTTANDDIKKIPSGYGGDKIKLTCLLIP